MPYYINSSNELELVQLVEIDHDLNLATFATSHASRFITLEVLGGMVAPNSGHTGFFPNINGMRVINNGSAYNAGGECWGMSCFADWYYETFPTQSLINQFSNAVDGLDSHDIIATRAHMSVGLNWTQYKEYYIDPEWSIGAQDNYYIIINALNNTGKPVVLYLREPGAFHAILATAWEPSPNPEIMYVHAYDPNHPGIVMTAEYLDVLNDWNNYDGHPYQFHYIGTGSVWTNEPYENILEDADADPCFHDDKDAVVDLTSHEDGEFVCPLEQTFEGTIESGEILIEKLVVETASDMFEIDIPLSGEFELDVDLAPGENQLIIKTQGLDGSGNWINATNNLPSPFTVWASDGPCGWVRTWGNENSDITVNPLDVGIMGYIDVAGQFRDCVDFDPGQEEDFECLDDPVNTFVSTFDPNGGYHGVVVSGGTPPAEPGEYPCDTWYATYPIAGPDGSHYYGLIDYSEPGINWDYFRRFEPDGQLAWTDHPEYPGKEFFRNKGKMLVDMEGNCYVLGITGVDTPPAHSYVAIRKYSKSGNLLWYDEIGPFHNDYPWDYIEIQLMDIFIDNYDHIFLNVILKHTVYSPTDPTSIDKYTIIAKYDLAGDGIPVYELQFGEDIPDAVQNSYTWAWVGGSSIDGRTLIVGECFAGNVFLAGEPYELVYGNFYCALNPDGTVDWVRNPAENGTFYGMNKDGGVYRFSDEEEIIKYNSTGIEWTKTFDGEGDLEFSSIYIDWDNKIYTCGRYRNQIDFNPDPDIEVLKTSTDGSWDAFLLKLMPDGTM